MRKKLLAAFLTATMVVAAMTGCGNSGTSGSGAAGSGTADSGNSSNGGGHYRYYGCILESILPSESGGYRNYGTAAAGFCSGSS